MARDVKVDINLSKPIGTTGTWFPMIYVVAGAEEAESYKEFSGLDEVSKTYTEQTDAYKAANLIFMQKNAPDKIAILKGGESITDILPKYITKGWRQLVVIGDYSKTTAEYIETTEDKVYFTHFNTVDALKTAYKDIAEFEQTFCVVYTNDDVSYPEAAIVGATAGLKAGSFTYKNVVLKGVSAIDFTDTEIEEIHSNGGITILEKAGNIVTSEGTVASGEYLDIIDSKNYIVTNIAYKVQKVFNDNDKVPYTDNGIALLEAAVLGVLVEAYNSGMIADSADGSPAYSTSFALRSQTKDTDRAERNYPYGKFAFELSGAIHTAYNIVGTITV